MYFDSIISNSSEVEKLEERGNKFWLKFGPNQGGEHVPKDDLKVILDRSILFGGIGPRFQNHGNNILFFGDEAYRQKFLRECGFSWEWIYENLLPKEIPSEEKLAEVIPFPQRNNEKKTEEPLQAAL